VPSGAGRGPAGRLGIVLPRRAIGPIPAGCANGAMRGWNERRSKTNRTAIRTIRPPNAWKRLTRCSCC